MRFLLKQEYYSFIKQDVLETIIDDEDNLRVEAEQAAIEEMRSYLEARYDTQAIFTDIQDYDSNIQYPEKSQVLLNDTLYMALKEALDIEPPAIFDNGSTYIIGSEVWHKGNVFVAIAESTGNLPFDTDFWELVTEPTWIVRDGRNPLIRMYLIDLVLFHLHSRISPRNIPEHRIVRYDQVIAWLKKVALEKINPMLPKLADESKDYVLFGSNSKRSLHY